MNCGRYNDFGSQKPRNPIQYPNNTLCAVTLLTPSFFNSTFIEYLKEHFKRHHTFQEKLLKAVQIIS